MAQTPTERAISDSNVAAIVEDAQGRQISVRYPSSFLRMRLARYIGADLQQNQEWWGNAIIALAVTAIDDVPVLEPKTIDHIEGTIFRLDEVGMLAVAMWVKGENERRSEIMEAAAKNSPESPS